MQYTLQAGPFSISSQSTSWHLSVKTEHYEQSSQHNQYFFTPYQLNQGREFIYTSWKALTSEYEIFAQALVNEFTTTA